MPDELAIALAAALILAAVAAAVIAVRTRRVVATPTERMFPGTSPRLKRFTVRRRRSTAHRNARWLHRLGGDEGRYVTTLN